jgi:NAD(P)-dependent dehydrogenase (short-subunit alcohol dehydrogenase family)
MIERMDGKVAIVTGAGSGIGRATALAFAQAGAAVVVADHSVATGNDTVACIHAAGAEAVFVRTDVSQAADVAAMVAEARAAYGRLDYAFNNAGIAGAQAQTPDCSDANWDRVIGVNLTGVFLCMKHEIPAMLKYGGGAIVNCSSIAGLGGFPGIPAYVASKHGVIGLTKTAALEYAIKGIRVNAVCPGVIRTPMVEEYTGGDKAAEEQMVAMEPMGRMGEPEEIASAVLYLCSGAASFVTGHAMVVDGGVVAR